MPKPGAMWRAYVIASATFLFLLICGAGLSSADVAIGMSSPPLDNLQVTPGENLSFDLRIYNNSAHESFVAQLTISEELRPYAIFSKDNFPLEPGTSEQVQLIISVPNWGYGTTHTGEIRASAVVEREFEGGISARVVSEITKEVVMTVPPLLGEISVIRKITVGAPVKVEVKNVAITELEISVLRELENVAIIIRELVDRPAGVTVAAPGIVYRYLDVVVENATDEDIDEVAITFKVPKVWIDEQGVDDKTITLSLYDAEVGKWISLPTIKVGENDTHIYYSAASSKLSFFAISSRTAQASALMINPTEVVVGETVKISVLIMNVENFEGTFAVVLKVDGIPVEVKNVTLAAGASKIVSFTVSENAQGTYEVEVDGLTGSFTVVAPSFPWGAVIGVVAIVSTAIGAAILYKRRRLKKSDGLGRGLAEYQLA